MAPATPIVWLLPGVRVTLIITLLMASLAIQRAISIDSDQAPNTKSESNPMPEPAQSYQTAPQPETQAQATKVPQATSFTTLTTTAANRRPTSPQHHQAAKQNGRVRRPIQAPPAASSRLATKANVNHGQDTTSAEGSPDLLQEEIKRVMAEYGNTPPLFVTSTRDFFVDVARYPLGFKLATMQALDSEGDRIEYSLKPANYRDASPYFAINATSGELRLANKRIPLQMEANEQAPMAPVEANSESDSDDGADEADDEAADSIANGAQKGRQLISSMAEHQESVLEKPGYLYFLNVAANDGRHTSIVELQIHVFNSTSFGTKSPVQLTIEGGRRGGESAMRAKTNEFFDKLYRPAGGPSRSAAAAANSTLVFPSFINPSLAAPGHVQADDFAATTPSSLSQLQGNELKQQPSSVEPRTMVPNLSAPFMVEPEAHYTSDSKRQHVDAMMQQPMMLSFAVVICACFTIALVLLIFVVPLSVKRLKRRLKNMELQHEQLSQKASNGGSSIVCSSANSTHSMGSSMATSGHLPSLSQFTLSGSDRSCPMLQMPSQQNQPHQQHLHHNLKHHHHHHHHPEQQQQQQHRQSHHHPLGRQSSLDSAITGDGNFTGSSLTYQTQRYLAPQHSVNISNLDEKQHHLNHSQQQQQQQLHHHHHHQHQHLQLLSQNGLNRINNGAIANPVYLHGQSLPVAQQANEMNNIYCPIDDDFYSTINNELDAAVDQTTITPSDMIVGQTCDSRNYFASQCAPLMRSHAQQQGATINRDNQRQQQCDRDTPQSRSSSRSSTRSLTRFLSLPARHWSQQQQQQQQLDDESDHDLDTTKRKSSFLEELEYHFRAAAVTLQHPNKPSGVNKAAQTIARVDRIGHEQQVRLGKRPRGQQQQQQHIWELERHRLKFIDILDEGQFGMVWRCKLRPATWSAEDPLGERTVAVKTLKKVAAKDEREREELLAEIDIMKRVCGHPNVVKILHCCTHDISQSKPILLVMEHVELGKLQSFLEKSRTSHSYATSSSLYNHASQSMRGADYIGEDDGEEEDEEDEDEDELDGASSATGGSRLAARAPIQEQLTSRELIKFIYHVAKGMEYISSNCIVHRDLASRNILISAQRVCKIGDFGMARHMGGAQDIYERRSQNTKIPVRWMAPEVLLHNSFTTKSDVYSFGILMWEIVTLGSTPYANLQMGEIVEAVARAGERPRKPDYCHSLLYSIMSKCWSVRPDERPGFSELVRQLDELLLSTNEYIELDQYPDHNYYNITAAPGELI